MNLVQPIQVYDVGNIYSQSYSQEYPLTNQLLILNGVTGVGRSTVGEVLQAQIPGISLLRNFTTRSMRHPSEQDRLIFGNTIQLQQELWKDALFYVRWPANGHTYALLRTELDRVSTQPKVLFETTHFGWPLKAQSPQNVVNIWLTCEDEQELWNRLTKRGTEASEEKQRRFRLAVIDQRFILRHRRSLMDTGKVDAVISTVNRPVYDIAQEIMRLVAW